MPDLTPAAASVHSEEAERRDPRLQTSALTGTVFVLIQFDVCEEIKLTRLSEIISARALSQPSMKHPAPGYIRYQRPPIMEPIEPLVLESGERLCGEIKYYDYGVLSVVFQLPFTGDWETLVRLASRWVWDVDFSAHASRIVKQRLERLVTEMDFVPREEFEVVKAMAAKARAENESLAARIAALESKIQS